VYISVSVDECISVGVSVDEVRKVCMWSVPFKCVGVC
jgi:hypothetical protein